MKLRSALSALALALTATGCGRPAPDAEQAEDRTAEDGKLLDTAEPGTTLPAAVSGSGDAATVDPVGDSSSDNRPPSPAGPASIPDRYRGRWGMAANDCQSGRDDAKGLITIGERSVQFYESVAMLKRQLPAIATSFSGLFAFTGEGHSWEKVMTFTRTGDALVRADDDGRYSYRRC